MAVIHIENPTRCHSVSKFYLIFIWSSTCFGRHTAHHQEPKTALAASGFACVEGCWTCSCWTLSASSNYTSNNLPDAVDTVVCAPDDGWKYHPKHVEQFPDINKLCNVASCWIYIGILLGAHCFLHISRIRVKHEWNHISVSPTRLHGHS